MSGLDWTKQTYEASISSKCWWFTPYDAGWEASHQHGRDLRKDAELREIVAMERALGQVPGWARRIVTTAIRFLPPCGHYLFPHAYLDAVAAIGAETPPAFVYGCYTVERARKQRMSDYLLCLDAWLAGAAPEAAARESEAVGGAETAWGDVRSGIWQVLGERTETKELLVERALHRHRWWLKSMVWDDDARDQFCRDQYLGDVRCRGDHYGNPHFADPYFAEARSPRIAWVEDRLAQTCPDWPWFQTVIRDSWLCAPKAFRFLERLLWSIGKERPSVALPSHPLEGADDVPGFLQCEETYPNPQETAAWWRSFLTDLRGWWPTDTPARGQQSKVAATLGTPTPVKRWLVRLLVRKLELCEQEDLAKLVKA